MKLEKKHYYPDVQSLLDAVDAVVIETDTVLDVGCGIVPMNYFRPKLHIMVEPWFEYSNILKQRHGDDKSVLILKLGALEALGALHDKSIDSVFLLDVIEHLEKDDGIKLVSEINRVVRQQAVIFTPLGFMQQYVEAGEADAWGLSGAKMQEHKSGWLPEDFGAQWEFHICENYHQKDFRGELLEKPYGAFFAVLNCEEAQFEPSPSITDIRRPLPSEIALQKLEVKMAEVNETKRALEEKASLFSARAESLVAENAGLKNRLAESLGELQSIKESSAFKLLSCMARLFPRRRG